MTLLEAKQALCRKLNIDYTDIANNDIFTATDLLAYIQAGSQLAWDRHPWDFTETIKTGTLVSGDITAGYLAYPVDLSTGSANSLIINAIEFPEEYKLKHRDYLKWKRLNPTSTDRYWSEYNRNIYFNAAAVAAGQTYNIFGKLRSITLSGDTDLIIFSTDTDNQEDSGNNAIVDLAYAEALGSEKLKQIDTADKTRLKAFGILDKLWEPMEQYRAQQQVKNRPFFLVPNLFAGRNETQRTDLGNFNL